MREYKPVEVVGSDNRKYFIERDRFSYGDIELSLVPIKLRLRYHDYNSSNADIHKGIVERYISDIKSQFQPDIRKITLAHRMLNGTQVNNYFDYMHLLQQINPVLEELLNKSNPCNDFGIKTVSKLQRMIYD